MASKMAGKKSDKCMEALRKLSKEEILEVLEHDGFCADCQARLDTRLQNLLNTRMGKISIQNDGVGDAAKSGTQIEPIPEAVERKHKSFGHSGSNILLNNGLCKAATSEMDYETSEEQQERIRLSQVGRKKDFVHFERVNGKSTNILQGLELHTRIFNEEEQKKIVDCVYALQHKGEKGQLRDRTFSAPKKWMRGKGRVTLQFGCCYNYATDKSGNPPGIVRDEKVDPLPPLFKKMIRRMVRWNVLPATCIPNSCIVNIYDEGDCIPPHIDHHDFLRPFCTVSFLSECKILFGSSLKVVDAGEFTGPVSIPLPVGSVFILSGNGADVAKHCVPGVPAKRISITFRKMDDSKLPQGFSPDPELLGIKPITKSPAKSPVQQYPSPTSKSPVQQYSTPTSKSPVQQYSTPTSKSPVQQYSTPPGHSVLSSHYQKNHHQDNKPLHSESDFPPLSASPANQRNGSKAKQNK